MTSTVIPEIMSIIPDNEIDAIISEREDELLGE